MELKLLKVDKLLPKHQSEHELSIQPPDDEKLLLDYVDGPTRATEDPNPWKGKYDRRQNPRD